MRVVVGSAVVATVSACGPGRTEPIYGLPPTDASFFHPVDDGPNADDAPADDTDGADTPDADDTDAADADSDAG